MLLRYEGGPHTHIQTFAHTHTHRWMCTHACLFCTFDYKKFNLYTVTDLWENIAYDNDTAINQMTVLCPITNRHKCGVVLCAPFKTTTKKREKKIFKKYGHTRLQLSPILLSLLHLLFHSSPSSFFLVPLLHLLFYSPPPSPYSFHLLHCIRHGWLVSFVPRARHFLQLLHFFLPASVTAKVPGMWLSRRMVALEGHELLFRGLSWPVCWHISPPVTLIPLLK